MGEANVNTEVAKHLGEGEHEDEHEDESGGGARGWSRRHQRVIEIGEALLLAIVAVATAWSGYQAAKWDGESARNYATASKLRVESEQYKLESNQTLIYNTSNLNSWLQAAATGDAKVADLMARRFTPEYRLAFNAWLKTDPLNNKDAPLGPRFMPEYKDPLATKSAELDKESSAAFDEGVTTRGTGEKYVRLTVILAAVLFLIAIGQRFKLRGVRDAVLITAGAFLVYCVVLIASLPKA